MNQILTLRDYDKELATILSQIKRTLTVANSELLLRYKRQLVNEGLSQSAILKYLKFLRLICANYGIDNLSHASKTELAKVWEDIMQSKYSLWTKKDFGITLKKFYRWLRSEEGYPKDYYDETLAGKKLDDDTTPYEVKNIHPPARSKCMRTPSREDLLTEEEISKLIKNTKNFRDKAFLSCLYESAARISEIGSLRLRDVKFDEYGAVLNLIGKTGQRAVRIIASAQHLKQWMENHPFKNNRNAPLWIMSNTDDAPMTYDAFRMMLKRLMERCHIDKDSNPHLFRHSRLTHLAAQGLTEYQLNQFAGWVHGSQVASTYVKLSGRDLDDKILEVNGIVKPKEQSKVLLQPIQCPRCKEINAPDSISCNRCWLPLGVKAITNMDDILDITLDDNPRALAQVMRKMKGELLKEFEPILQESKNNREILKKVEVLIKKSRR